MTAVHAIPAFNDNYIWLLENADATAVLVDPGDAEAAMRALAHRRLTLSAILITHHHFDHVGGLEALRANTDCIVYGPHNPAIDGIDHRVGEDDRVDVGDFSFSVLAVPGHTLDHIAYFQAATGSNTPPLLFCGDTLFAGGCGRIFEGDAPMMYDSLQRLAALPGDTMVYCAHEYTLANLAFARAADPTNTALAEREVDAKRLRSNGQSTVPSQLATERATNPFLRADQSALRASLLAAGHAADASPVGVFAALRSWKDNF